MRRKLERKRRITSFIYVQLLAVDPDRGSRHHPFKINENLLALGFFGQAKAAPVQGHELVLFFIKTMPGQAHVRMRYDYSLKVGVVEIFLVPVLNRLRTELPTTINRKHEPTRSAVRNWRFCERMRRKPRSSYERARSTNKVASIH